MFLFPSFGSARYGGARLLPLVYFASTITLISDAIAATSPSITPAPKALERQVQNICGFWTFASAPNAPWSFWCSQGPCAIDTYVTPNIVFCASGELVPYTTFYGYGSWPQGGCGSRESCCPSIAPVVRTHVYDQGASLYFGCEGPAANESDGSRDVLTSMGDLSVSLSLYSTADAVTKSNPPATPAATTSIPSPTSSPAAASSTASTQLPRTTSSSVTGTNDSVATPSTANNGGGGGGTRLNLVAVICGVVFGFLGSCGALIALLAYIHTRKRWKEEKLEKRRREIELELEQLQASSARSAP